MVLWCLLSLEWYWRSHSSKSIGTRKNTLDMVYTRGFFYCCFRLAASYRWPQAYTITQSHNIYYVLLPGEYLNTYISIYSTSWTQIEPAMQRKFKIQHELAKPFKTQSPFTYTSIQYTYTYYQLKLAQLYLRLYITDEL